jgi:hypothetical protein
MRIREDGKLWDVWLCDDGTLDTVIAVQPVAPKRRASGGQVAEYWPPVETRFDGEYAAEYRDKTGAMSERGLRELGREAVQDYSEDWQ